MKKMLFIFLTLVTAVLARSADVAYNTSDSPYQVSVSADVNNSCLDIEFTLNKISFHADAYTPATVHPINVLIN